MRPRLAAAATLLAALIALFSSCGGDSETTTIPGVIEEEPGEVTGDAASEDVEVIEAWSDALREGEVRAAAKLFATPSVAENGGLTRINNLKEAVLFNLSLPCGAKLVRAEGQGDFTTATFELTERPGPGTCGPGAGGEAETAFVIEDGKITEWRRVDIGDTEPAPGEAV